MSSEVLRAISDISELRRIAHEGNISLPSISQNRSVFEIRDLFFLYLTRVLQTRESRLNMAKVKGGNTR